MGVALLLAATGSDAAACAASPQPEAGAQTSGAGGAWGVVGARQASVEGGGGGAAARGAARGAIGPTVNPPEGRGLACGVRRDRARQWLGALAPARPSRPLATACLFAARAAPLAQVVLQSCRRPNCPVVAPPGSAISRAHEAIELDASNSPKDQLRRAEAGPGQTGARGAQRPGNAGRQAGLAFRQA